MNPPIVVITSKGHAPRMRAHRILVSNGYSNWRVVLDDYAQAGRAVDAGVPAGRVAVTDRPLDIPPQDGIAWTRQWIEENLVARGEWYVSLDDNVSGWTGLPDYGPEWVNFDADPGLFASSMRGMTWREAFDTPLTFQAVVQRWCELIEECDKRGTIAGGFAIEDNYFFRGNKWQTLGYVRAQNAVWKNTGLPFYYWKGAMLEDFVRSVDAVARTGSILINRFVKPQKKFFEEGGIGSFEERRPNLTACCQELMRRYPGLLRPVKGRDYSLTFAKRGRQLDAWRREHGFIQ